ncbi:MAG: FkbM family methyltransferase [Pseudomonadales bacterium]
MKKEGYQIAYVKKTFLGKEYFLPEYAMHKPAVQHILNDQYYEPETHRLVGKIFENFAGSMIHAGTFYGDMIPSFSESVTGFVYAFEPVLENYILARMCIQKNRLENVFLFNSALSSVLGNIKMDTGGEDGVHHGGACKISDKGFTCTSVRIDNYEYSDLKVIQLDLEGSELEALKGAFSTIERHRPVIMVEDNSNDCRALLEAMDFFHVKNIPGLKIWAPIEAGNALKSILS